MCGTNVKIIIIIIQPSFTICTECCLSYSIIIIIIIIIISIKLVINQFTPLKKNSGFNHAYVAYLERQRDPQAKVATYHNQKNKECVSAYWLKRIAPPPSSHYPYQIGSLYIAELLINYLPKRSTCKLMIFICFFFFFVWNIFN